MPAKKILVTGAFGLVGSDLVLQLQKRFGEHSVVAMGHSKTGSAFTGVTVQGDVRDRQTLETIVKKYKITEIYHLAGLLSVGGEKDPQLAWDVNVNGLKNVLDIARDYKFKVFWPSSIAAFGPTTPKHDTPQHTILEPTTMYGVNKVSGELLCQYYFLKYGVDVRSLRYPGLLGYKADPGDGTTEYAVWIFYSALEKNSYVCYLRDDTVLPMMYMDDAIKGTIDLMEAPAKKITIRTSYNFAAMSFTPKDLVKELGKFLPGFSCTYTPDHHQAIADSWPQTIDDSVARRDWGWKHAYDLSKMTQVMLEGVRLKLQK